MTFSPSLFVMRLQAYLPQALPPTAAVDRQFLRSLDGKDDPTINDIKKTVLKRWGRVEIVDATVVEVVVKIGVCIGYHLRMFRILITLVA